MIRVDFYGNQEDMEKLELLAKTKTKLSGMSITKSHLIRLAIKRFLKNEKTELDS